MQFHDFGLKKFIDHYGSYLLLSLLVVYTFFMLARSVVINYQLQKQTKEIKESISTVQIQNQDLENLILYYQTDSFREVEARRKLGLKKPDEKIFTVSVQKFTDFGSELQAQKNSVSVPAPDLKTSNLQLWWQYLTQ